MSSRLMGFAGRGPWRLLMPVAIAFLVSRAKKIHDIVVDQEDPLEG